MVGTLVISIFEKKKSDLQKGQVTYLLWGHLQRMDEPRTKPRESDSEMLVLTPNIPCFHQIRAKWHPFVWSQWIGLHSHSSDAGME